MKLAPEMTLIETESLHKSNILKEIEEVVI